MLKVEDQPIIPKAWPSQIIKLIITPAIAIKVAFFNVIRFTSFNYSHFLYNKIVLGITMNSPRRHPPLLKPFPRPTFWAIFPVITATIMAIKLMALATFVNREI